MSDIIGGLFGEGIEELFEYLRDRRNNQIAYEKVVAKMNEFAKENGVEVFLEKLNIEIKNDATVDYLNKHRRVSDRKFQKLETKAVERYNKELIEAFYDRIGGLDETFFEHYKTFQAEENRVYRAPFLAMINEIRTIVLEFKFRHLEEEDKIMAGAIVASVTEYFDKRVTQKIAATLKDNLRSMFFNAGGFTLTQIKESQDPLRWAKKCCPNCGNGGRGLYYDEQKKEIYCGACGESYFAVEDIDGIRSCLNEQSELLIGSLKEQGVQITDDMKREFRAGLGQIATKDYLADRLDGVESTLDSMQERAEEARASLQQCVMEHIDEGTDTVLNALRGHAAAERQQMMQISVQLSSVERMVGAVYQQVPEIGEDVKEMRKLFIELQRGQYAGFKAVLSELKSGKMPDRDEFAATLAKSICSQIGVDIEKLYKKQDETLHEVREIKEWMDSFDKNQKKMYEMLRDSHVHLDGLTQTAAEQGYGVPLEKCKEYEEQLDEKAKEVERYRRENDSLKRQLAEQKDIIKRNELRRQQEALHREQTEAIRELAEIRQEIVASVKEQLAAVEQQMGDEVEAYRLVFRNSLYNVIQDCSESIREDDGHERGQSMGAISTLDGRRKLLGKNVIKAIELKDFMTEAYASAERQIEEKRDECGSTAALDVPTLTFAHIQALKEKLQLA